MLFNTLARPNTKAMGMKPENSGPPEAPEDDHDVLTFREAGARLQQQIQRDTQTLRELEAQAAGADELDAARARLADLKTALERHTSARGPAGDPSAFFGPPY